MKPLDNPSIIQTPIQDDAALVIETVLLGMRTIRTEMRKGCPVDLSIPQFRMLLFLKRHSGASISDLAEHIGLTLPSMSKTVDGLVKRGLVSRETSTTDRRRAILTLTTCGEETFMAAKNATRAQIAEKLDALPPEERATVILAMQILRPIFTTQCASGKCSR